MKRTSVLLLLQSEITKSSLQWLLKIRHQFENKFLRGNKMQRCRLWILLAVCLAFTAIVSALNWNPDALQKIREIVLDDDHHHHKKPDIHDLPVVSVLTKSWQTLPLFTYYFSQRWLKKPAIRPKHTWWQRTIVTSSKSTEFPGNKKIRTLSKPDHWSKKSQNRLSIFNTACFALPPTGLWDPRINR